MRTNTAGHYKSGHKGNYRDSAQAIPEQGQGNECINIAEYVGRELHIANSNAVFTVIRADAANVHIQLLKRERPELRPSYMDPSADTSDNPIELISLCEFGRWIAGGVIDLPEIAPAPEGPTQHEPSSRRSSARAPAFIHPAIQPRIDSTGTKHYPTVKRLDVNKPVSVESL